MADFDGSSGPDTYDGTEEEDFIFGNAGNDVLNGLGGNDYISGGIDNDQLGGGSGLDQLDGGNGDDDVHGGADSDLLLGGLGDDDLFGGTGTDLLKGGAGTDTYDGGEGDETESNFIGGFGDRISFLEASATQAAVFDLRTGIISNDGFGNAETATNIESIGGGTVFADQFYGNSEANYIVADLGDIVMGFEGDDQFQLGAGPASLDGGEGVDRVVRFVSASLLPDRTGDGRPESFNPRTAGVVVDLAAGTLSDGYGNNGTIQGIEHVGGSTFADQITGDGEANELSGGEGDDRLAGGGAGDLLDGGLGVDRLEGGAADDSLDGGLGADTAEFLLPEITGSLRVERGTGEQAGKLLIQQTGGEAPVTLFEITFSASGTSVTGVGAAAALGTDTLGGIERLRFQLGSDSSAAGAVLEIGVPAPYLLAADQETVAAASVGRDAPRLTLLADGSLLLLWVDEVQEGAGAGQATIRAQKYTAAGAPAGDPFAIATGASIDSEDLGVTALESGGFAVVWTAARANGAGDDVLVRLFDSAGVASSASVQIAGAPALERGEVQVIELADGQLVAAWKQELDGDLSATAFRGRLISVVGSATGAEFPLAAFGLPSDLSLSPLAGGGFVAAWAGEIVGSSYAYFQEYGSSGSAVGSPVAVDRTIDLGGDSEPAIAVLADGSRVVAWIESDNSYPTLFVQRFGADNQPLGDAVRVSGTAAVSAADPKIALVAGGGFVLAWTEQGSTIKAQAFASDGAAVGNEFTLVDHFVTGIGETSLVAVGSGFAFAWGPPGGRSVGLRVFDANSDPLASYDLAGGGGADSLAGTDAADILDGRGGADTMAGGTGNDSYFVDNVGDQVVEAADAGTDTVHSSISYELDEPLENLVLLGTAIGALGNAGANRITGNRQNNDIDGAAGADTMAGGAGDDKYAVDAAGDRVIEQEGEGTDLVVSTVTYTLGGNLENLTLGGALAVNGTGNALANVITGNAQANELDGKGGADTMSGLGGNDTYLVDNAADKVIESTTSGSVDTVRAAVSYVLAGGSSALIENLVAADAAATVAIDLTGNEFVNSLGGNAGNNVLDGKGGADTMTGRGGNDTYVVDDGADTIVEDATSGSTDTVRASVDYVLANGVRVEQMITADAAATDGIDLTGNDFVNSLTGNAGANKLDGKAGADTMSGLGGNDSYVVDNAGDKVIETATSGSTDTVRASVDYVLGTGVRVENLMTVNAAVATLIKLAGNEFVNSLTGDAGANQLDGKGGVDTMSGLGGNDVYVVDDAADKVVETATSGSIDTVRTSVDYVLGAGVLIENLATTNAAAATTIKLTGNEFVNSLTGDAGANTLDGRAGADTMSGLGGNDSYLVDNAGDKVIETATSGSIDTVRVSVSYYRLGTGVRVENLVTVNAAATTWIRLSGNEFDNNLTGNAGANTLDGGGGADIMSGLGGYDTYVVNNARDKVIETATSGSIDTVQASVSYTLETGVRVENLTTTSAAATAVIDLTGNEFSNSLTGNAGVNTLDGKAGADTMSGLGGNDLYFVDDARDKIIETATSGSVDTVRAAVSYVLGGGVRVEKLTTANAAATSAINLSGNEFANSLTGNAGANRLDGRAGADTMTGLAGNDVYFVDNAADSVVEQAGGGADTVNASTSYSLRSGQEIETLILSGTSAINAIGNEGANRLVGNSAANVLDGGAGKDRLEGGAGNDTYVINDGDLVIEASASGGTDLVMSSLSYQLPNLVENLTLTGVADLNGTGNGLDNVITGNAGRNSLTGNGGRDKLNGGGGADILSGGAGQDILAGDDGNDRLDGGADFDILNGLLGDDVVVGGDGEDQIWGGAGADVLYGGNDWDNLYGDEGNDFLDGGAAADDMYGGAGNDVYIVDSSGDTIGEYPDEGTDEVRAAVSYSIASTAVENLIGTSATGQWLTGNDLANVITSGGGADRLYGGNGRDTLRGGAGDDTYVIYSESDDGGAYFDTIVEAAGGGIDTVELFFGAYVLPAHVENGIAAGEWAGALTGNDLDNRLTGGQLNGGAGADTLTGGEGSDRLDGGTGADTMRGGAGFDIYIVDTYSVSTATPDDLVIETADGGLDEVRSSVSYVLPANVEYLYLTGSTGLSGTGNGLGNYIEGTAAADKLFGGAGNDLIKGGSGADGFYFDTALNAATNVDYLTAFAPVEDSIFLSRSIFTAAGPAGGLSASAFHAGSAAADAGDRIIHDQATGRIYYDPDGTGAAAQVHFATILKGTVLTSADFIVYG